MTATAARPATIDAPSSPVSAVLALARFEGKKTVTHPVVWLGALASAALAVFELFEEAPVLNRVSITLAWTMAPLAVAVALVTGWSVLRARGRSDANPPMVMPVAMGQRVAGILLGLVWPAAGALVLQLALLASVYTQDPVTSTVWTELLVGPMYLVFAGALSGALTRWLPHPSTPLFGVLLLAGLQIVVPYNSEQWGSRIGPAALAPIAWPENIIPYEVSFRPSTLHLGYLVGLVLVVGAIAALGRSITGWTVLALGVVTAATLGPAQLGPIEDTRHIEAISRLVGDEADLGCETHDSVTYCAMPGYEGWIDDWAAAVTPMLDLTAAGLDPIEVRQYPIHNTFLLDGEDYNYWWWIKPAYEDYIGRDVVPVGSSLADHTISYDLVGSVASRIVGCEDECEGESQRLIYLWLAGSDAQIRENVAYQTGPASDFATVDECMVAGFWDDPDVKDLVHGNWEVLTNPNTTYQEAGEILGVAVPVGYDELGNLEGGCP